MRITDIIECSNLIEIFGSMEISVLNTKYQLACESSMNSISYELLNDLKTDLTALTEAVEAYPRESIDTNRIISEGFVKINKAKRTNSDIVVYESILDDMLIEFVNKRKSIVYDGDVQFESFVSNLHDIYDHYITETTNNEVGNDITFVGLMEGIGNVLANIKNAFGAKHDKLVTRDQKWLKDNKKKLIALDYNDIELEVPSDYKVTFASLINHHDIFDKNFKGDNPSADKINRFKDKSGNLKNGLDNYYRTGSSRREIGLRKVSGNEAKNVVKSMIEYCNDFLAGKKYIDDKLDSISEEVKDDKPLNESVIYNSDQILEEGSITNGVKSAWSKVEELDRKLYELLFAGVVNSTAKYIVGMARASAKTSVKLACLGPDLSFIRHQNEQSILTLKAVAKKKPGNKALEDYIDWLENDFVDMINKKEKAIKKFKGKFIKESVIYEAGEDTSKNNEEDDDLGLEDDPIDDIDTEDNTKEPKEEKSNEDVKKDTEDAVDENNLARDRQTGITVLMTIAEERYFDYMDILTSLLK